MSSLQGAMKNALSEMLAQIRRYIVGVFPCQNPGTIKVHVIVGDSGVFLSTCPFEGPLTQTEFNGKTAVSFWPHPAGAASSSALIHS